jgi:tetratricopeptide (TPR) repeat protein
LALTELVAANLMTESTPGRYDTHDLLAAYAAELARDLAPAQRRACLRRLLDHYLQTAFRAARLVEPFRTPPPMPSLIDDVSTVELADYAAGLAWLRDEYPVLMATINDVWATPDLVQAERDAYTWRMAWCLGDFHLRHCYWQDQIVAQQAALAAATRLDDRPAQARSLNNLAGVCERLNHHEDARAYLHRALRINRREGDIEGQAVNHANLAWLHIRQIRATPALCHARRSLELYRSLDHRDGYAFALTLVGESSRRLGDHEHALECLQEALAVNEELGDRRGQAESLEQLGHTHLALAEHGRAEEYYRAALELTRHQHDRDHEAAILSGLGDCLLANGQPAEAREQWLLALSIIDSLDPYGADDIRAKLGEQTSLEA